MSLRINFSKFSFLVSIYLLLISWGNFEFDLGEFRDGKFPYSHHSSSILWIDTVKRRYMAINWDRVLDNDDDDNDDDDNDNNLFGTFKIT